MQSQNVKRQACGPRGNKGLPIWNSLLSPKKMGELKRLKSHVFAWRSIGAIAFSCLLISFMIGRGLGGYSREADQVLFSMRGMTTILPYASAAAGAVADAGTSLSAHLATSALQTTQGVVEPFEPVSYGHYTGPKGICQLSHSLIMDSLSRPHMSLDLTRSSSLRAFTKNAFFLDGQWVTGNSLNDSLSACPKGQVKCGFASVRGVLPCPSGRSCLIPFHMRCASSDAPVALQLLAGGSLDNLAAEYGFETVLDAGGNCGIAAALLAMMYPKALVVSVEASSETHKIQKLNTQYYPNVRTLNAAIWSKSTDLALVQGREGEWSNEVFEVDQVPVGAVVLDHMRAVSIPDLAREFGLARFDLLKIDIEGAEKEVFHATRMSRRYPGGEPREEPNDLSFLDGARMLVMETHDKYKEGTEEAVFKTMKRREREWHYAGMFTEHETFVRRTPTPGFQAPQPLDAAVKEAAEGWMTFVPTQWGEHSGPRDICGWSAADVNNALAQPHDCMNDARFEKGQGGPGGPAGSKMDKRAFFFDGAWRNIQEVNASIASCPAHGTKCAMACVHGVIPCPSGKSCLLPFHMRCRSTDAEVAEQLLNSGFLDNLVSEHDFETILDAGGNCGIAAAMLAMLYPRAAIVTIEASSATFEVLRLNTQQYPNVRRVNAALWPRVATLAVVKGREGEWSNEVVELSQVPSGGEIIDQIEAVSVAFLLQAFSLPGFELLKIDIEGAELELMRPDPDNDLSWLDRGKFMVMETHDKYKWGTEKQVHSTLHNKGDWDHLGMFAEHVVFRKKGWPRFEPHRWGEYVGPSRLCAHSPDEIAEILARPHECFSTKKDPLDREPTRRGFFVNNQWTTTKGLNSTVNDCPKGETVCVLVCMSGTIPCPHGSPCVMPVNLRCKTTDAQVADQLLVEGTLDNVLPDSSVTAVLDGGGNCGIAASLFAMLFPQAIVVTVEASSSTFDILRKNTHIYTNVRAVNAALWPVVADLVVVKGVIGEWSNLVFEREKAPPGTEVIDSVQSVSIPYLLHRFGLSHFDFLKIDIEGSELELMQPGYPGNDLSYLDKGKFMVMETHDRFRDGSEKQVMDTLSLKGWSYKGMFTEHVVKNPIVFTNP